jgi:hypothetical protein
MARRDTAVMAAASWPDANVQFRRERRWHELPIAQDRRRRPVRDSAFFTNEIPGKRDDYIAARRALQWAIVEKILFGEESDA